MKLMLRIGSWSIENMLLNWKPDWLNKCYLKWKRDWRKECFWNGSGKFYEIYILFCDELSATNCPRRIVRDELSCDELSATNCPATNCPVTLAVEPVLGRKCLKNSVGPLKTLPPPISSSHRSNASPRASLHLAKALATSLWLRHWQATSTDYSVRKRPPYKERVRNYTAYWRIICIIYLLFICLFIVRIGVLSWIMSKRTSLYSWSCS